MLPGKLINLITRLTLTGDPETMSRNISTPTLEEPRLVADPGLTHSNFFMITAVAVIVVAAVFYVVAIRGAPLGHVLATSSSLSDVTASPRPRAVVRPVSSEALPNVKGKRITTVLVEFPPGGFSPPHHHGGSVTVYVLSGVIRSQLEGQVATVYRSGETFFEPTGVPHLLAEKVSTSEPATILAIFVADEGATLTTYHE